MNISIYEISRGGDVTYHGPGQIVGYPILDIRNYGMGVRDYIFKLEEVFIAMLKNNYNINADRGIDKYTGIFIGENKITAIGVAIKKYVSMHGFAFNVNTDLSFFDLINPCGIKDKGVTSLKSYLNKEQNINIVKNNLINNFKNIFKK